MARTSPLKAVPDPPTSTPDPGDEDLPAVTTELDLGTFDGKQVVGTAIKITNAGDGLSKAMKVDPIKLEHGDRVVIVLEGVVKHVDMVAVSDDLDHLLTRVQVVKAETAAVIDRDIVGKILDAQAEKIEQARGVTRLPFGLEGSSDDPDDLE